MLAVILKELRCYTHSSKYRRIQFLILCGLALLLLVATVEFYAQRTSDVGKQVYTLCMIVLVIAQLWVPRHAVEALHVDRSVTRNGMNGALLVLSPLANWQILVGKLSAVVLWAIWGIWLTIPLFALSGYIGGLAISKLVKCGAVLLVSCIFFALIGIGFALCNPPIRAKGISYGVVVLLTFLPLIPIPLLDALPTLYVMSPLCALLSILSADATHLWLWNIGLFCVLSILIFPVLMRQMRLLSTSRKLKHGDL